MSATAVLGDVLGWVDDALAAARADLDRAVDRVDALVELRSLMYGAAAEMATPFLTLDDLERTFATEKARAQFRALAMRATNGGTDAPNR